MVVVLISNSPGRLPAEVSSQSFCGFFEVNSSPSFGPSGVLSEVLNHPGLATLEFVVRLKEEKQAEEEEVCWSYRSHV